MIRTVTEAYEVPKAGSREALGLAALMGKDAGDPNGMGFLVGFAAGKAAANLPNGAKILRVVVVAELDVATTHDTNPEGT